MAAVSEENKYETAALWHRPQAMLQEREISGDMDGELRVRPVLLVLRAMEKAVLVPDALIATSIGPAASIIAWTCASSVTSHVQWPVPPISLGQRLKRGQACGPRNNHIASGRCELPRNGFAQAANARCTQDQNNLPDFHPFRCGLGPFPVNSSQ